MARRRRDTRRRNGSPAGPAGADVERRRRKGARHAGTAPAATAAPTTRDHLPPDAAGSAEAPQQPPARAATDRPPRHEAGGDPAALAGLPPGRRNLPRRRRWLTWAAAATAAAVLVAGVSLTRRAVYSARLPALPELSGQPPALREHLEAADRAARNRPTSADAVGALGLAYHADLFLDQADRAYAVAETLGGGAWRWTYYRALAHGTRGDNDALADGLRQVVAAAPEFGPAWWRLGEAEFKAGRHDSAAEAWRRALSLDEPAPAAEPPGPAQRAPGPSVSEYAALGLARVALVQGDAEGAAARLEDVTAAAPGFGPAFRLLADAYATLGRVEDAARALRTADRLPLYEPYPDRLSEALVRESRSTTFLLQQAATVDLTTNSAWREHLIRRALEVDPNHRAALAELATMYRVVRRYDEALEVLDRQRRLWPDDLAVLADIGRCLSGLGRYAEAEPMFRRAIEEIDDAPTRYALGLVLDRTGRPAEAMAEYRLALDRNPNHLGALNNLGVALATQGRMDEAARHFSRLTAVSPGDADAHANLGLALAAAGAPDRAARALRQALRLDPDHADARAELREIDLTR